MSNVSRALSRPIRSLSSTSQRRLASSSAHDAHDHHDAHDQTVYPKEGFTGPVWRNTALAIAAIYGVAKFASSEEDEEPWLTRVLSANTPSVKEWVRINEDHLAQSEQRAGETLTAQTAQPPLLKRHTKPLHFEQVSPHRVPVGGWTDSGNLAIRP